MTTKPTREHLADCPFCGGKPEKKVKNLDERYGYAMRVAYQCSACGCERFAMGDTRKGGYADNSTVEARAMTAWNTRAKAAPEPVQGEAVAKVISKYGDPEAFGEREIEVLADLRKIPYGTRLYPAAAKPDAELVELLTHARSCVLANNTTNWSHGLLSRIDAKLAELRK